MQMYRSHFKEVLQYQYPDHYGIVLKLLLRGLLTDSAILLHWLSTPHSALLLPEVANVNTGAVN